MGHLTAMALPMKKVAAMKAMKAMKAKRVSIIAKGKMARAVVFRGSKVKTQSGMTKDSRTKKNWGNSALKSWCDAVKSARKALNLKGFVAIGGKTAQGKALYAKAKSLLK